MTIFRKTSVTTNTAVLDISQTTELGNDVIHGDVCNLFEEGCVGGCSANDAVVGRELPTQYEGGESHDEDRQGEEHNRRKRGCPLSGGAEYP